MKTSAKRSLRRVLAAAVFAWGSCSHQEDMHAQEPQPAIARQPPSDSPNRPLPPTVPAGRQSIGIALEGGGALGIAHIGVIKWMFEHHVPVDRVAGTSMGALIGSLLASGHSIEEIERLTLDGRIDGLFTLKPSLSRVSFRQREDRDSFPQALTFGLRNGKVSPGTALIVDDQLNAFLAHELVGYNSENLSFDDMPIPFRCVATDLTTLQPAIFQSGSLPLAVRASISIPGVFPPVHYHGDLLVDGAIVDNLPTDVLRSDLHADVVIAVHLSDASFEEKDATSLLGIFARAFQAGTNRNEQLSRSLASIEILPDVKDFSPADYSKGTALLRKGYEAADAMRDRLIPYALSPEDWNAYVSNLKRRQKQAPARIDVVRVEGPDRAISAKIQRKADHLAGTRFDVSKAGSVVEDVRGAGTLDAYYDTLQTPSSAAAPGVAPADNAIEFHWRPRVEGPPYLQLGTDVLAMSSNVTRAIFNIRLLDENLGGYGSELRSDVRLGYLTSLHTEYYRPLGDTNFFIQPEVQFDRDPVYLWEDQKRVSERLFQRAGGGLDFGLTLNRNFQTDIEFRDATIRWDLQDGSDSSPTQHVSGVVSSIAVRGFYSDRTAEIASPRGSQVDVAVGRLLAAPASKEAPFLRLGAMHSFPLSQKNVINVSLDVNTYFRRDVADPLRFTLGGPLRLYASSMDEYRGTDTALTRLAYLRRIAKLPTGLGQGVYLTTGYEAGSIWSPEQHSILRKDGFGGVLVNTPLGAITFGGALGDGGRRKVFFTFGRLF